jgi:hypothetical protein
MSEGRLVWANPGSTSLCQSLLPLFNFRSILEKVKSKLIHFGAIYVCFASLYQMLCRHQVDATTCGVGFVKEQAEFLGRDVFGQLHPVQRFTTTMTRIRSEQIVRYFG